MKRKKKNPHALALGKMAMKKLTHAERVENGRKGGRPRTYRQCPKYRAHIFLDGVCKGCGGNSTDLKIVKSIV